MLAVDDITVGGMSLHGHILQAVHIHKSRGCCSHLKVHNVCFPFQCFVFFEGGGLFFFMEYSMHKSQCVAGVAERATRAPMLQVCMPQAQVVSKQLCCVCILVQTSWVEST